MQFQVKKDEKTFLARDSQLGGGWHLVEVFEGEVRVGFYKGGSMQLAFDKLAADRYERQFPEPVETSDRRLSLVA